MSVQRNDSLRKQLYSYIKGRLDSGELKPGDPINQKQISEDLGISKTPFRDCMIQLETEGIVTIIPCKGVFVRNRSFEEFMELHEIGRILEAGAYESAFYAVRERQIPNLTEIVRNVLNLLREGDMTICHEKNAEFHMIILKECPNKQLIDMVINTRNLILEFPRKDFVPILKWEILYWNEHQTMLEIIKNGTPEQLGNYSKNIHWKWEGKEGYFEYLLKVPHKKIESYLSCRKGK